MVMLKSNRENIQKIFHKTGKTNVFSLPFRSSPHLSRQNCNITKQVATAHCILQNLILTVLLLANGLCRNRSPSASSVSKYMGTLSAYVFGVL